MEIEGHFYVDSTGIVVINNPEIYNLVKEFDFTDLNSLYHINIENDLYFESIIESINNNPKKAYQISLSSRFLEFPQCNKTAVEYRWNSTRIWIPSDKVEEAGKALVGDLDLGTDDPLEIVTELYSHTKRNVARQQMLQKK